MIEVNIFQLEIETMIRFIDDVTYPEIDSTKTFVGK